MEEDQLTLTVWEDVKKSWQEVVTPDAERDGMRQKRALHVI